MVEDSGLSMDAHREVEAVFGRSVPDGVVDARAKASKQQFVRNQTQVGIWNERATGRVMTAFECLHAFGRSTMAMLAEHEVVPFVPRGGAVGPILRHRGDLLGAGPDSIVEKLARSFGEIVAVEDLLLMEAGKKKIPVRLLTKLSRILALDSWKIGAETADEIAPGIVTKLRSMTASHPAAGGRLQAFERLDAQTVLDLAEAFWMIATQATIDGWLSGSRGGRLPPFRRERPRDREAAYSQGRAMAADLRKGVGLTQDEPIADIVSLCEDVLGVPVVSMRFSDRVAGAALATADHRGIVANVDGINGNPGTFRITVGHELCHIAVDDLNAIHVGTSQPVGATEPPDGADANLEEYRAQAFASELLAPHNAAYALYQEGGSTAEALGRVMDRFGVSYTCALRQSSLGGEAANANIRAVSLDVTRLTREIFAQSSRWRGQHRTGKRIASQRFEFLCTEARARNLISEDTHADLTSWSIESRDAGGAIRQPIAARVINAKGDATSSVRALSEQEWTILFDVYVATRGDRGAQDRELVEASVLFRSLARTDTVGEKNHRPADGLRRRLKAFEDLDRRADAPAPHGARAVWQRFRKDVPALRSEAARIRSVRPTTR